MGQWVGWREKQIHEGMQEKYSIGIKTASRYGLMWSTHAPMQPRHFCKPWNCPAPLLTWWWLDGLEAGVDAAVVAAAFVSFALRVWAAARHFARSLGQHLGRRRTPVILLVLRGLRVVRVLVVLRTRQRREKCFQKRVRVKYTLYVWDWSGFKGYSLFLSWKIL